MRTFKQILIFCGGILFLSAIFLGASLTLLPAPSVQAAVSLEPSRHAANELLITSNAPPTFPVNALIAPAHGSVMTSARPTFDWADAVDADGVVSYTLLITGSGLTANIWGQTTTATVAVTESIYRPARSLPNAVYTWTVRAFDPAGYGRSYRPPSRFTIETPDSETPDPETPDRSIFKLFSPLLSRSSTAIAATPSEAACPEVSVNVFRAIPFVGPPADHPDYLHGDLNLNVRGYMFTTVDPLRLIQLDGPTSPDPPQLDGLFGPNRLPDFVTAYRVKHWNWGCGEPHGCPGPPITYPPLSMAGLAVTPGEPIFIPERNSDIFRHGNVDYQALVLYADKTRLTLGYTRDDSVAHGFAVHLENICVDPNLLSLYRAQVDEAGWRLTGLLPAVSNDQLVGTALGRHIGVVIRDRGTFEDPRSQKDWWQRF